MADTSNKKPGPFDVSTVRELVEMMAEFELTEINLSDGEQRLRLRKGGHVIATPIVAAQPVVAQAAAPVATAAPTATAAPAPAGKKLLEIKSELVGTFYAKPAPDKDDFVKVGSKVGPETTVCTVEAMKIFNAITAKVSGTIAEVCAKNGDFVDFDQVLFRVDPS